MLTELCLLSIKYRKWMASLFGLWPCKAHLASSYLLEWNMIEQIWNNAESLREFIFSVLHDSHQDLRAPFCTILWAIWECRNKKLWEDIGKAPQVDYSLAMKNLEEWKQAKRSSLQRHESTPVPSTLDSCRSNWSPPSQQFIKCNLDSAMFKDIQSFGIRSNLFERWSR